MPDIDVIHPEVYDPTAGKAAFTAIEPRLRAMSASELGTLNVDTQAAATIALAVVKNARAEQRARKLALFPEELLAKSAVGDLEQAAWATWYCHTQALSESAAQTRGRVDVALINESAALLDRVLKLVEYHVGHIDEVALELAAIKSGVGHQDRASDLVRAAALWERYEPELSHDQRRYQTKDGAEARRLAQLIVSQLQESVSAKAVSWQDLRLRAYARMVRLYDDVCKAAGFAFRDDPRELALFPPLRSAALAHFGRRKSANPAPEPVPAPEPATPAPPPEPV